LWIVLRSTWQNLATSEAVKSSLACVRLAI
jgi:hypothetical protein